MILESESVSEREREIYFIIFFILSLTKDLINHSVLRFHKSHLFVFYFVSKQNALK